MHGIVPCVHIERETIAIQLTLISNSECRMAKDLQEELFYVPQYDQLKVF